MDQRAHMKRIHPRMQWLRGIEHHHSVDVQEGVATVEIQTLLPPHIQVDWIEGSRQQRDRVHGAGQGTRARIWIPAFLNC